jgi:hypothetical protein
VVTFAVGSGVAGSAIGCVVIGDCVPVSFTCCCGIGWELFTDVVQPATKRNRIRQQRRILLIGDTLPSFYCLR